MNQNNEKFPKIKKSIHDFIGDEDGSITRSKLIAIGSMVLLMTMVTSIQAYAAHKSHSSHSSHSSTTYYRGHASHTSHTSHSSHSSGSHSSHSSSTHSNHSNHASHASHTSHANTASHSNSLYSAEGDVKYGPAVTDIPKVASPQSTEGYAKITLGDKLTLSAPLTADLNQPEDIQAVDFETSD